MVKLAKVFLMMLIPLALNAVKVSVSVNKYTLGTNDQLHLTLRISDSSRVNVSEPSPPQIPLFTFRNITSSSSSAVSLNGSNLVSEYSQTYTYIYLPTRTGTTTIPTISVKVNNREYRTQEIAITVVKGQQGNPNQSAPAFPTPMPFGYNDPDLWQGSPDRGGNTFLIALPAVQYVFRGFPVIVSYYLYTDEMVRSFNLEDEKDYPGYGKTTYQQPTMLNYEDVRYQGKYFKRALIKRLALIPNQEGELLAPRLEGIARLYSFGYLNKALSSTGGKVVVRPLPRESAPVGFGGAVGNFNLSHNLSKTELALGEALTFTLKIQGKGNFNQFAAPQFTTGKGFQVSTPMVVDNLTAGIEGTRIYYYTLIPQNKGEQALPELSFTWFAHDNAEYRTWHTPEQKVSVTAAHVLSYLNRILEQKLPRSMYPKTNRDSYPSYVSYVQQVWYWLVFTLLIVVAVVVTVIAQIHKLKHRNPDKYAYLQADRILRKYMKPATQAAQSLSLEFYTLGEKALMDYLSSKYKLSNRFSTLEKIALLSGQGVPDNLISDLQSFLQNCQNARYLPDDAKALNINADLNLLKQIITGFSRISKNNKEGNKP